MRRTQKMWRSLLSSYYLNARICFCIEGAVRDGTYCEQQLIPVVAEINKFYQKKLFIPSFCKFGEIIQFMELP